MTESPQRDTGSPRRRTERTLLNVDVYDALAAKHNPPLDTVGEQAEKHRVLRQHWSAIRNGHSDPSATLALRVAADFGVPVTALWRLEQVAA